MSKIKRHIEKLYMEGRKSKDIPSTMDFDTWQTIFLSVLQLQQEEE
tara:strand:- start:7434 stop:7571 length:138 start_codon:yes stop_codon:yes gene_type:complete